MSNFGYHKQLGKYEDIDEDELLASLTNEEIQELEKVMAEIEPDMNIPTGLREEDQTDKQPMGTFSREALLKYWEDENHRLLEVGSIYRNWVIFLTLMHKLHSICFFLTNAQACHWGGTLKRHPSWLSKVQRCTFVGHCPSDKMLYPYKYYLR